MKEYFQLENGDQNSSHFDIVCTRIIFKFFSSFNPNLGYGNQRLLFSGYLSGMFNSDFVRCFWIVLLNCFCIWSKNNFFRAMFTILPCWTLFLVFFKLVFKSILQIIRELGGIVWVKLVVLVASRYNWHWFWVLFKDNWVILSKF